MSTSRHVGLAKLSQRTEASDTTDLVACPDDSGRLALRLGENDIEELKGKEKRSSSQRTRPQRAWGMPGRELTSWAVGTGAMALLIMPDMLLIGFGGRLEGEVW